MGPLLNGKRAHDDQEDYIRVNKIPGYSIVVTYNESKKSNSQICSDSHPPPQKFAAMESNSTFMTKQTSDHVSIFMSV